MKLTALSFRDLTLLSTTSQEDATLMKFTRWLSSQLHSAKLFHTETSYRYTKNCGANAPQFYYFIILDSDTHLADIP